MDPNDGRAALCTANRGNTDDSCRCIASDCMAWEGMMTESLRYFDEDGNPAEPGRAYSPAELREETHLEVRGDCMLKRGKP